MLKFPFEVPFGEMQENLDVYVSSVFSCLESEFLVLPKGPGFIEYATFEEGYEALKRATGGFADIRPELVLRAVRSHPVSFIVLRSMLGFTPPEWAYVATQRTGIEVTQGAARSLDRRIRMAPEGPLVVTGVTASRLGALVKVACQLLSQGAPDVEAGEIHRLGKADTRTGADGIRRLADMGAPYAVLLYERFLGRPFAGHRDSVSDLIGGGLESTVEDILSKAGISFRKTKRAERIEGFDQAPDFIVPSELNPQVVIEAKITQDDGTARDKVTRIQHLAEVSLAGTVEERPRFQVVACIGGRGFAVRREDMKKLLVAAKGKVFTPKTIGRMVDNTRLRDFRSR